METGVEGERVFRFGRFNVVPQRREVLADGERLELGDRAFDLLIALIDSRGTVISKDELMRRAWPGRIVEENSLQAQISALRKAFGADRDLIRTVAGRGYQFVGQVRGSADGCQPATNVPERVSELIGRDTQIREVLELLAIHRLVTLTGAGGVGKTQLALEIARRSLAAFPDGVWVAQLGPLSHQELVPATVASAVGLTLVGGSGAMERVCAAIAPGRTLLVLDSCEHVIEAAAAIAEGLLKARSAVHVIATSREPLRAEGEYVYRVPSLDVPPDTAEGMTDPPQWAAVKLFVARAREAAPGFALDKHVAALVAGICRRLDGIPLALELAATRTAALGVEALAARLDDRFGVLTGGRRTALPRHQTLRATLDWSYDLLSDVERVILRRLAVFAGGFSLQAASAVAADKALSASDVVASVANLVTKSLVTPGGPASAAYRLLETTRAYASEKLTASGEFEQCARRHAAYYGAVFQRADAEWETRPSDEWLSCYGPCLDNLRAALDWAFSPNGDRATGIALTVAALPLWFQLSLIDECLARVGAALSALGNGARTGERQAMQLHAAHGWSLMYTTGPARETGAPWAAALRLAERLDDTDHRLRALWGLWAGHINNGEFRAALALAETFRDAAKKSTDAADRPVGERMLGVALHFLGDQTAARRHIEEMLCQYMPPSRGAHIVRFQFDQRVTARITLARVLWLQGFADQAMATVENNLQDAVALNHSLSIGNALAQAACPIALLCGDLDAAERFIAMFLRHTARSALDVWHTYGRCFSGMLQIKRGDLPTGLVLLLAGVDELRKAKFTQYETAFLLALAEGLAEAGRIAEGLAAIDEGLARSGRTEERWCLAELLRVKGDLESMSADPREGAVQQLYTEALECARLQGALSWELRAASSLARLWLSRGRAADARALLEPVRNRFTEGFGTMDLKSADELLSRLR